MKLNLLTITFSALLILFFVFASNAQTNNNSSKGKEKAIEPSNNENCPDSGFVRLRVTFHNSGKVTKVELIVSGGCKSFDEKAIKAAQEIKLPPKTKNDKPVIKIIEYTFEAEQSKLE